MSLRVLVCLKAALDPIQELRVAGSPPAIFSNSEEPVYALGPADRAALEDGLFLKEKHGAEVTALSLGGLECELILRTALAAGVDRAIYLFCPAAAVPDAWAAAKIVATEIAKGEYDLVLCGDVSLDDSSGIFGPCLGEILGWAQASRVVEIDYDPASKTLTALRALEHGDRQRVQCRVPAVLSINPLGSNPRYVAVLRVKTVDLSLIQRIDRSLDAPAGLVKIMELSPARARPRRMATPGAGLSAAQRMRMMMGQGEASKPAAKDKLFEGTVEAAVERILQYLKENGLL